MKKLSLLSEKLSKYIIAAVLIVVSLLPKFPLIKVPGTYVAIRAEDVLMLVLALMLIPKFITDFGKIKKDKIFTAILIFFVVTFISLISGAFISQTVQLKIGLLHWARRIEYIVPFLATYFLIPSEKIKECVVFYFKVLLIVVVIAFVYGMGQRYLSFPIIITQNEQYSKGVALLWTPGAHINSTFAGHYDLSAFVVLILPIFLGALFAIKGWINKLIIATTSGMGLWLLINSVSRSAQATYLLAITIALFLQKKFKAWFLIVIISLTCMFMSTGLGVRFSRAINVFYRHITTGAEFGYVAGLSVLAADSTTIPSATPLPTSTPAPIVNDVSVSIRLNVEWPRAIRAFYKNPILGTGYSSIDLATDNDYLRMLGETGILGLSAFVLVFLSIGKILIKTFSIKDKLSKFEKSFLYGVFGGVAGTFATAILIDIFEASKLAIIFWLILGCAVSLVKSKLNEE